MANSDKNILITPNTGSATLNPLIRFTGANNTPITLRTLDTGTVSFEGTAGQLFSIADGMSGTIFSVNDISGIPSIEVLDTGIVRLAQYGGNVGIGISIPSQKLHVVGNILSSGTISGSGLAGSLLTSTVGTGLGTASAGTATVPARADHVHPTTGLVTTVNGSSGAIANVALTTGAIFSGPIQGRENTGGTIVNSNDTGSISIRGNATTQAAAMSFHRVGNYAINMGLDTDNVFKIGGWSAGSIMMSLNASGNLTVPGIVTGSSFSGNATTATSLNSSNFISNAAFSGNLNTDFQNTPPGAFRQQGDTAGGTNNPGGSWWVYQNMRHANGSNFWGTQVAWGWEDNANRLATRNVQGGGFGGWVYYINNVNHNTYGLRNIQSSTSGPSGGSDGDVWIQYT
jgi:hypothetical protein